MKSKDYDEFGFLFSVLFVSGLIGWYQITSNVTGEKSEELSDRMINIVPIEINYSLEQR